MLLSLANFFGTDFAAEITLTGFLFILCASIVCGLLLSILYIINHKGETYDRGLPLAIVIVPIAAGVVIMIVGRNIAAGLGLSGIFVLTRFRSGPVQVRDLAYLFVAICAGVLNGTGCVGYGMTFTVIMFFVICILEIANWGVNDKGVMILKIWIPESLDYQGAFDPILRKFTTDYKLLMIRTTDFGSMCELRYRIIPKAKMNQKAFLDQIRTRNGNMNVVLVVAPSIVDRDSRMVL